ncbi:uncharacterized protein V6R79_010188 [Siganus canaliculatus]
MEASEKSQRRCCNGEQNMMNLMQLNLYKKMLDRIMFTLSIWDLVWKILPIVFCAVGFKLLTSSCSPFFFYTFHNAPNIFNSAPDRKWFQGRGEPGSERRHKVVDTKSLHNAAAAAAAAARVQMKIQMWFTGLEEKLSPRRQKRCQRKTQNNQLIWTQD